APLTLSRSPALGIFASESDEGRRLRPDGVRGPLRDGVGGAVAQEAGRLQAAENQGARCRASQRHQSHGCAPPQRAGAAGGAGAYEVRKPEEYFSDIEDIKVPGEMLKLAEHIVERSVVPSMPLPHGSKAMTRSRLASTMRPSATMPLSRMASRMTANASCPTLSVGAM